MTPEFLGLRSYLYYLSGFHTGVGNLGMPNMCPLDVISVPKTVHNRIESKFLSRPPGVDIVFPKFSSYGTANTIDIYEVWIGL